MYIYEGPSKHIQHLYLHKVIAYLIHACIMEEAIIGFWEGC